MGTAVVTRECTMIKQKYFLMKQNAPAPTNELTRIQVINSAQKKMKELFCRLADIEKDISVYKNP